MEKQAVFISFYAEHAGFLSGEHMFFHGFGCPQVVWDAFMGHSHSGSLLSFNDLLVVQKHKETTQEANKQKRRTTSVKLQRQKQHQSPTCLYMAFFLKEEQRKKKKNKKINKNKTETTKKTSKRPQAWNATVPLAV